MVLACTAFVFGYIEYFSPVPVDHFYVFGKMSLQIFCPFIKWPIYFWLLSCLSFLCILDINSFLDMWFADILLSHFISCLFILFMISFDVKKLFSLVNVDPVVHFLVHCLCIMCHIKKNQCQFPCQGVLYLFSSRSCIV